MRNLTRRRALLGLGGACLGSVCGLLGLARSVRGREATEGAARRVVCLDLLLTETLLTLDFPPLAVGNVPLYRRLVALPAIPDGTSDLGPFQEPNLELLQALAPDLILAPAWLKAGRAPFARIAPVVWLQTFSKEIGALDNAETLLRHIARLTGREAALGQILQRRDRVFERARNDLTGDADRPLLVVRFMEDGRHAAVFGGKGMIGGVLGRLGLRNAWTGRTNVWGVISIGIEQLAAFPEARLVHFDRGEETARALEQLDASPLWHALPMVRAGRVLAMPVVYPNGGLFSAMRFAEQLAEILPGKLR